MLPRIEDKEVLEAILDLENNPSFNVIMLYLNKAQVHCSQQACIQQDDSFAKKYAGGFMTLKEFCALVYDAEERLARLKGKKK